MFVIGVTGPIGSGKSTVAKFFKDKNIPVIDADVLSHEVLQEKEIINQLVDLLGVTILDEAGNVLREVIAEIVFQDKKKLDLLSLIVHQAVLTKTEYLLNFYRNKKEKIVVLDFPLPVKNGFLDKLNYLLVPHVEDKLRIERLIKRGMSEKDILARIEVQMPSESYEKLAQLVLINDGTMEDLFRQLEDFLQKELEARGLYNV